MCWTNIVMTSLTKLFFDHEAKVVDKWEQYLGIYESELSAVISRGKPVHLLEVGVQNGGSLELWGKYLPAGSQIVGVDIDPSCAELRFQNPFITVHTINAANHDDILRIFKDQSFDIIIDDGSHVSSDITSTFNLLFPRLKVGGRYFIEDLECSYYRTHDGGLFHEDSSIAWLKHIIDSINADHIRPDEQIPPELTSVIAEYRNVVSRITFYDSMAVVDKLSFVKQRPFRRVLSGQASEVESTFDLLTLQPRSIYQPMVYGATAARQLDQSIVDAYEAARSRLAAAESTHAQHRRQWQQDIDDAKQSIAELSEQLVEKDSSIATLTSDSLATDLLLQEARVRLRHSETGNADKDLTIKELRTQLWSKEEDIRAQTRQLEKTNFRLTALMGLMRLIEAQGDAAPESWRFDLHHEHSGNAATGARASDDYRLRALRLNQQLLARRANFFEKLAHELQTGLMLALRLHASAPLRYLLRMLKGKQLDRLFELQERSLVYPEIDPEVLSALNESGLFDAEFYTSHNRDLRGKDIDPVRHFLEIGAVEGRDPHGLFGIEEYLADHTDVAAARLDPFLHFIQSGASEGRAIRPGVHSHSADKAGEVLGGDLKRQSTAFGIIRSSGLFDEVYYRNQNPDIDMSIDDAILHYVEHGVAEARDPCESFSTSQYLSAYSDIAAADINPFMHYIVFGVKEDLDPKPNAMQHLQPSAGPSPDADIVLASGLFDAEFYREHYQDVRISEVEPFEHFMVHGLWEDRKPNAMFDPVWYRSFYPDIAVAGANPFLHYLQWGASEGRSPCIEFDGQWYLETNPDLVGSGEHALRHYIRTGRQEGRLPTDPHAAYRHYILRDRQITIAEADDIRRHIAMMYIQPRFVVFIDGTDSGLRDGSREALRRQFYTNFTLLDATRVSDLREQTKQDGECYLVWLKQGDVLHERALYEFASEINADPAVDLVYADVDTIVNGKRAQPFFKPDWSPDYLESLDYISNSACFAMDGVWQDLFQASSRYDFVLRFTERHEKIGHIRKVLCHLHREIVGKSDATGLSSDKEALIGRLQRTGRRASVSPIIAEHACFDLSVELRKRPLVSVVIPTAGKVVNLRGTPTDLLFHCIDTIVSLSTYENLEFIIVDNGDLGAERAALLDRRGYTRLTYDEQQFNIAKKLNLGVTAARGELLLLLNDDVEPLVPNWIERLVEHFEKPHVGVVGSKLLYPDFTTQHVGVVLNAGVPDHVRRFKPSDEQGYFYSTMAARNYVAITGACMMTRVSTYNQVGGYTEALSVNYNDADYCLKVIETGKTVVYAPRSELIHFESQSREARVAAAESQYFAERWAGYGVSDPYYNERNLTVASPTFEVANNPRLI